MQENIFIFSDASYVHKRKIASCSVYFSHNRKYYNKIIKGLNNSNLAELSSVLFALLLAKEFKLENIIILYDNNQIPVDKIKTKFKSDFEYLQFVWVKRNFLDNIDFHSKSFLENFFDNQLLENQTVSIFIKYPLKIKLYFFKFILTDREKILIDCYLYNTSIDILKEHKFKSINSIKYVYSCLSADEQILFFDFLIKVIPKIKNLKNFHVVNVSKLEIFLLVGFNKIKKINNLKSFIK